MSLACTLLINQPEAHLNRHPSESMASNADYEPKGPMVEVHSGWMKKRGQGSALFGGKFQKRYFVLYDNRELHYLTGAQMAVIKPTGVIQMAQATGIERLKPDDRKDFTFAIKVPGRDWVLDPGSMAAWQEWEEKLLPMLG